MTDYKIFKFPPYLLDRLCQLNCLFKLSLGYFNYPIKNNTFGIDIRLLERNLIN